MQDEETLTIDGLCDVEVKSSETDSIRTINSLKINAADTEINILGYLPEGWYMKIDRSNAINPIKKTVEVVLVPEYIDGYSNQFYFSWLLSALHEVGHAHNQYHYSGDPLQSRDRASTINAECSFEDIADMLHDEMGAWRFALERIREIDPDHKKEIKAYHHITSSLASYLGTALNPTKIHHITGIQQEAYVEAIVNLYQTWLDTNMPEFGIDYTIVRVLKDHEHLYTRLKKLFDDGTRVISLQLSSESADFLESLQRVVKPTAVYLPEGMKIPEFRYDDVEAKFRYGAPEDQRSIQIINNPEESNGDYTFAVIFQKDLQEDAKTPDLVSLGRHLHVGRLESCLFYDFTKINIPVLFGIESLTTYDGLLID